NVLVTGRREGVRAEEVVTEAASAGMREGTQEADKDLDAVEVGCMLSQLGQLKAENRAEMARTIEEGRRRGLFQNRGKTNIGMANVPPVGLGVKPAEVPR